jgi:predicted nucleotide-binding protein
MKILFQGGWKAGRNPDETKETITKYCSCLARHIVTHGHTIVLSSNRDFDRLIADEVCRASQAVGKSVKDHLLFLLPQRETEVPTQGRVVRFPEGYWWSEERTYYVQHTDAVIVVGGGRGTFDCAEKAFLCHKPVFVAAAIPCKPTDAWKNRARGYKYLEDNDADFLDDINVTPDEFFTHVFAILNKLAQVAYSRRVFVVHGHDDHARDTLADILRRLQFDPVILQDEASHSLTIIEKLERDTGRVGFAFIIYTPDDLSKTREGGEQYRARQNVVFEHGLLIGLLGRERTCAIIHGNVEIPSDIQGMLYERIGDFRNEAIKVAKVLKQAGYSIDTSSLL